MNIDLGSNYNSQKNQNEFLKDYSTSSDINQLGISSHEQMRNYYIKIDYTQPLGKNGSIEVGGKMDFNNNVVPNNIYGNNIDKLHTNDIFHYEENINSLYINYSKT
ncbi:outer membrane beta-barrel family protein, partial [Enterobacter hormaechei]|nr:outer membrane beta-barrel family protein [Enterobacter hormaechei]